MLSFLFSLFVTLFVNLPQSHASYQNLPPVGCPSKNNFNLNHFARVEGSNQIDIYRGGMPTESGMRCLKRKGIQVVVDLRTQEEAERSNEKKWAKKYGIRYVSLPISTDAGTSPSEDCRRSKDPVYICNYKSAIAFLELVNELKVDPTNAPLNRVYVHCARGEDRTGLALGMFRISEGWSEQTSYQEMRRFWYTPYAPLKDAWELFLSPNP